MVITVNNACKDLFTSRSCPEKKLAVVMNTPDESIFALRAPGGHNAADGAFVIMYHGSLVERNGLDVALAALALVREEVTSAELRIFGKRTPFLDRVLEDAAAMGLKDAVHYHGPVPLEDLAIEIGRCNLGVIPNHRSSFADINTPTRIFEYLALGRPVIAPRTKGIFSYFDSKSLLYFEAGDATSLAEAIKYAATHPEETRSVVERGQEVYLRHRWAEERIKLENLLSTLIVRGSQE